MTKAEFNASMDKLEAFMGSPKDRDAADLRVKQKQVLYEALWTIDPGEFEEITLQLQKTHSYGKHFAPGDFWKARQAFKDARRARPMEPATDCPHCKPAGFVTEKFRMKGSNQIVDATGPCPHCRKEAYDKTVLNPRLERIQEPPPDILLLEDR